ncbi:hypothetical protein DE146DRAFT_402193 [Phaeosphaeria sp. MPI-PUGE-AT-0046c]|nr:hypothetical protein DE146DRAFT_402193 [Phaeosphaeria sp. MPI-PUGE-AT-0046c]
MIGLDRTPMKSIVEIQRLGRVRGMEKVCKRIFASHGLVVKWVKSIVLAPHHTTAFNLLQTHQHQLPMHPGQPLDRVALACLQCRRRHIKCDATQPPCSRCRREGKECTYQASRRGGLDNGHGAASSQHRGLQQVSCSLPSDLVASRNHLLELYYEYFWPPFPMTLPYHFLQQELERKIDHGLEALLAVMQWIGSLYSPLTTPEPYYETVVQVLHQPTSSPINVQALTLFALGQHHCDEREAARTTLDRAIVIALQLRMNEQEFARQHGERNSVLEEAWRRTYYILYNVDQEFSVVARILNFVLADVVNTVDLPCDDFMYESGVIPPPSTWKDYENKDLEEIEPVFSSLTYAHDLRTFVASVRISQGRRLDEDLIDSIDVKVASWQALLPACKKDPFYLDGTIDEVMWQAHASAAVLMTIHRPVSALPYTINELATASFMALGPIFPINIPLQATHTARTSKALDDYGRLLAIACTRERHSVFSMCITAQMAAIQISACKTLLDSITMPLGRNRLRLFIGYLSAMGRYWPLGRKMANEVKAIARSTFGREQENIEGMVTEEIDAEVGEMLGLKNLQELVPARDPRNCDCSRPGMCES